VATNANNVRTRQGQFNIFFPHMPGSTGPDVDIDAMFWGPVRGPRGVRKGEVET